MNQTTGAVFLSYASEDAAPAQRICAALRAASIEVWFDQSELRGGDAWDAAIRTQIKSCALFIPIISSHSRARTEGYFRLEWKLAVDRSHLMAAEQAFLVPVIIDDTREADARVPDRFREIQWTRLPAGETTPEFVDRIHRLLTPIDSHPGPAHSHSKPSSRPRQSVPAGHRLSIPLIALAGLLILAAIYMGFMHRGAPLTAAAPVAVAQSIAVLPFTDLSEKKDQQYFSDGLSEEMIDLLAQIGELKVTARTSSFSFRDRPVTVAEIGRALGVSHLLEGSVRKAGDTIRITAQLVRADNGFHVWSATYDRDLKDVFKVQDDIARVVVDKLKVTLAGDIPIPATRTENTEAHNLLLQGEFFTQGDTDVGTANALAAFQKAVALDPGYAPAWAAIGRTKYRRAVNNYEPAAAAFTVAEVSIRRAIELDPNYPDAYSELSTLMSLRFDWPAARAATDKALQLDPGNPVALFTRAIGRQVTGSSSETLIALQKALDRDPLNLLHRRYAARMLYYAGRLDDAEAMLRDILTVSPKFPAVHYQLGTLQLARGNAAAAGVEFETESNVNWRRLGLPLGYYAAHRSADFDTALQDLLQHSAGAEFQIAEIYCSTGDADKAFDWLNKAVTGDAGIIWLRNDPLCKPFANDPRYTAVLKRINLQP